MYYISKTFTFEAAHLLLGHPKCGTIHGHSYEVQLTFAGSTLQDGMLIDFGHISTFVEEVLLPIFDHTNLNLGDIGITTAENIAKYIFDLLKENELTPYSVKVWETADNMAMYMED